MPKGESKRFCFPFKTGRQKLKDILNMCVISVKLVAPNFTFPVEM